MFKYNMVKKEIITINGFPGSGKSSTADLVSKTLGFQHFSSGDFMRKIALERGISLNELSTQAEKNSSIDFAIDNEVKKAGEMNRLVIDSRLAFHFIPNSFKVYLSLPPEIAKQRILKDLKINKLRQESETAQTEDEVYEKITKRLESEKKRYIELYNVDHTNQDNFDLVIDTNKNNLEEVANIIVTEYKKWISEN